MICIGRHVGGHAFALQHGGQNYFLLISCSTFHSYAQMCCKRYHIIFSTFSLKFNPFAPGDFAEKHVLKLVKWFSGHCRAIKG